MKVRAGPCLLSGEAVGQNPPGLPAPGAACNPPPRACGHVTPASWTQSSPCVCLRPLLFP